MADDDPEDRFIISMAFEAIGADGYVEYFEDGEKLISYLKDTHESTPPELIILDLNMPRLSGTEILKAIRNCPNNGEIPVIIFSTSVNEIEKKECFLLGATDYITKPMNYQQALEIGKYFASMTSVTFVTKS